MSSKKGRHGRDNQVKPFRSKFVSPTPAVFGDKNLVARINDVSASSSNGCIWSTSLLDHLSIFRLYSLFFFPPLAELFLCTLERFALALLLEGERRDLILSLLLLFFSTRKIETDETIAFEPPALTFNAFISTFIARQLEGLLSR